MTALSFDAMVCGLVGLGVPRDKAEARAREEFGLSAAPVELTEVDVDAIEKATEHEGDKLMAAFGFDIIRFSQPRATKQTPGISDRRYYRRPRADRSNGRPTLIAFSCWWEAKSATGTQTPSEREFQALVEACGETYLLGTHEVLAAWLVDCGIARRVDATRGAALEPVYSEHGDGAA